MRDIKFRAWDTSISKMVRVLMIWPGDNSLGLQYIDDGNITLTTTVAEEKIMVMQYTGLKDKKGVEIYEGDIITYDLEEGLGEPKITGCKEVVKYSPFGFFNSYYSNIRVIGNIHQNPELLKQ